MLPLRKTAREECGLERLPRLYVARDEERFDYTHEDSLAFGKAIETEVVPLAKRLLESRRQPLGVDTLRPWDLSVDPAGPTVAAPLSADVAELEEGSARMFAQVDPALGAKTLSGSGTAIWISVRARASRRAVTARSSPKPACPVHYS